MHSIFITDGNIFMTKYHKMMTGPISTAQFLFHSPAWRNCRSLWSMADGTNILMESFPDRFSYESRLNLQYEFKLRLVNTYGGLPPTPRATVPLTSSLGRTELTYRSNAATACHSVASAMWSLLWKSQRATEHRQLFLEHHYAKLWEDIN